MAVRSHPITSSRKVAHLDNERDSGNGYIVTLRRGWRWSDDPICPYHVKGFDTVKEAMADIRDSIPCACDYCTGKEN